MDCLSLNYYIIHNYLYYIMNLLVGYCSYLFNFLHLYGLIGAVSVPSLFKLELFRII